MIDEACALSGHKGIKTSPDYDDAADERGLQPGDLGTDGVLRTGDFSVSDAPHVASDLNVEATHTAVPELSHPGESQSNGLAAKSVRDLTDQFRTLKTARESRLKSRLASDHPIIAWLVEHTAYVLNKFSLGPDG